LIDETHRHAVMAVEDAAALIAADCFVESTMSVNGTAADELV